MSTSLCHCTLGLEPSGIDVDSSAGGLLEQRDTSTRSSSNKHLAKLLNVYILYLHKKFERPGEPTRMQTVHVVGSTLVKSK